jgi:hypothetical protein
MVKDNKKDDKVDNKKEKYNIIVECKSLLLCTRRPSKSRNGAFRELLRTPGCAKPRSLLLKIAYRGYRVKSSVNIKSPGDLACGAVSCERGIWLCN